MTSVCMLPEGGSVTVGIGDSTHTFRRGDRIDLDAVAVPAKLEGARSIRLPLTWRDVLGEHVAMFLDASPDPALDPDAPEDRLTGWIAAPSPSQE